MLVSEKLKILGDIGLVDWFESDDDSVRTIINGIAAYYFEDYSDFFPSDMTEANENVRYHFCESGYDIDWYELISLEFAQQTREDPSFAFNRINQTYYYLTNEELEAHIIDIVNDWCWNCRKAFIARLSGQ